MPLEISSVKRQLGYAVVGILIGVVTAYLAYPRDQWQFASIALANSTVLFLSATLLIGPLRVLRGQRPVSSSRTRRHLGVWSGIFAVVHVVAGLNVHFNGKIMLYFFRGTGKIALLNIRSDSFGITNHMGAAASIIVFLLLAISNDAALRRLGVVRWKGLQRLTYPLAAMVFLHAGIYQYLEQRPWILIALLMAVTAATLALQLWSLLSFRNLHRLSAKKFPQ